jgi:dolichol-phosphate mannosyltransferase
VDLLASAPGPIKFAEVPYTFRNRVHGESKLDIVVGLEYLQLLLDKWIHGVIPVTYLLFGVVGSIGAVANLALTTSFLDFLKLPFLQAQALGAVITIAINFLLNNQITFRSARLKGMRLVQGLALFYVSCAVGLLAQVGIAASLENMHVQAMPATIAGIVIGSVWNYSMAFLFVWHVRRHRTKRLQYAYAEPIWLQQDTGR